MIAEELEFQISQYVDGTLSVDERAVVDELLKADAEARKILADYRRLNSQLVAMNAGPSVHFGRLAEHLSNAIDDETAPVIAGRIGPWITPWRMRIAAAFLVAGTAWMAFHHSGNVKPPTIAAPPTSEIVGPQAEIATGPGVSDISVGPSEVARANASQYGGVSAVVTRPSKVTILGLNPTAKHDSHLH